MSSVAVRISEDIVREAKKYAELESRSVPKQIEHWIKVGRAARDNPDLPIEFIDGVLQGFEEIKRGEVYPIETLKL